MKNNILSGIGFENFRVFKEKTLLDFSPLTVLTGTNSSGKSSVINGLKLIKESFKDLKLNEHSKEFELDSLFNIPFNASEMMKRYGTLDKYVNHEGKTDGKNYLAFHIPSKLKKVNADVVISYKVEVENNDLNNGKLTLVEMTLRDNDKSLLRIEKKDVFNDLHKNNFPNESYKYLIKVDISFFYAAYENQMQIRNAFFRGLTELQKKQSHDITKNGQLKHEVDNLYKVYSAMLAHYNEADYEIYSSVDGYSIPLPEQDNFDQLMKHASALSLGKFYDFSFLWAEAAEDESLFSIAVKKFYDNYNAESLKNISEDLIKQMSSQQWESSSIGSIIYLKDKYNEDNIGLSLIDFSIRYFKKGGGRSVPNNIRGITSLRQKSGLERLSWDEIEKLNSKSDFLLYLIKVIANKESFSDKLWINREENRIYTESERKKTEIESFKPNETEKYFYEEFLFPNFSLLKEVFLPFVTMETVSNERSSTKGIKSLLDGDDFSRFMKKRFSAIGDEKVAINKLDEFLNKWLQDFKVAEQIKFEKDEDYDVFKVRLLKNNKWMMLSDEGFGVSQVLPVILSCCPIINWNFEYDPFDPYQYNEAKLVLIEEPETNLHPALQSKLADMFMDAIKTFNMRFIIETHSEYLVRKLQYLTGKGYIEPHDTVIYYFYPQAEIPEGDNQIKKINIQKEGSLTDDFGTGFFDEADKIALTLWNMNHSQKN